MASAVGRSDSQQISRGQRKVISNQAKTGSAFFFFDCFFRFSRKSRDSISDAADIKSDATNCSSSLSDLIEEINESIFRLKSVSVVTFLAIKLEDRNGQ